MEFYQAVQQRTAQTVAVINQHVPGLKVGGITAAELSVKALALNGLAQTRDTALIAYDLRNNAENLGYLRIRTLDLALPKSAEGDLSNSIEAEADLLDLLAPIQAIVPRTTVAALERGRKLVSALNQINAYLATKDPAIDPVTSAGKGVADLTAAIASQPQLEQNVQNDAATVTAARLALRNTAAGVDRLNKRFYSKLEGEARSNDALAEALGQIETEGSNQPETLGIISLMQGGDDHLHVVVSYENGSFTPGATKTLEWLIAGAESTFTHSIPATLGGNALGPFAPGQTIQLRTRVTNANGTTTGSTRTLKLEPLGV